jgi:hypothetical protein
MQPIKLTAKALKKGSPSPLVLIETEKMNLGYLTQLSGMDSGGKKVSYPVDFMKKEFQKLPDRSII